MPAPLSTGPEGMMRLIRSPSVGTPVLTASPCIGLVVRAENDIITDNFGGPRLNTMRDACLRCSRRSTRGRRPLRANADLLRVGLGGKPNQTQGADSFSIALHAPHPPLPALRAHLADPSRPRVEGGGEGALSEPYDL